MKTRLMVLAFATIDAVILLFIRQAATVDTSVWIALIAGVVGLLTLIIQTYGQIQLAAIARQTKDQNAKIDGQTEKIDLVHAVVNSGQTRLIEDVKRLTGEVGELKALAAEKERVVQTKLSFEAGKASAEKKSDNPDEVVVVNDNAISVVNTKNK